MRLAMGWGNKLKNGGPLCSFMIIISLCSKGFLIFVGISEDA